MTTEVSESLMSSLERGSLEAAFFSILSDIEVYKYLK
jgi:hypothetical protein